MVAGLNNLSLLLAATNRHSEAEPLLRRTVEIVLKFTAATGHHHSHLDEGLNNYGGILQEMGRSHTEIVQEVTDLLAEYGVSME